ncbi:MAG: hypothetical protein PVSMB9_01580 [Candidatus Dormibacteria bacterium]
MPLYFVLPLEAFSEPQADMTKATTTTTGKSNRFPNMESLPGQTRRPISKRPRRRRPGREPLCYPNPGVSLINTMSSAGLAAWADTSGRGSP